MAHFWFWFKFCALKNIFVLLFLLSLTACHLNKKNKEPNSAVQDSLLFHYKNSLSRDLELSKRKQEIDKAFVLVKKIPADSLYAQILYRKSNIHFALGQYDSLRFYNKLSLEHSLSTNNYRTLSYQYYLMGYYYSEVLHMSDSAFCNYNLSKNYFLKVQDSSRVGKNLVILGTIQKNQNDYFGSKETLTEALQYLNPENDQEFIARCYNTLATDHRKLFNYEDAISYYTKAIENSGSSNNKFAFQNNLATAYMDNREYEKAISLLGKISSDSLLVKDQKLYARVLDNLAYAKWLSGGSITERVFEKPLRIRSENKDSRGLIASYTHLMEYYGEGNPQKSKAYYDSVVRLSKKLKIPRAERDVLKHLMALEPNNVKVRDRYVFLQDSLYEQELRVKTQFAKYKYDDKLNQEAILRLEKENTERKLEVAQQRNQKLLSYGVAGFLTMISGFGIYYFVQRSRRFKQQSKTAKLEATYETEAELSRKLHDDFGGKLNHAMLLLQNGGATEEVLNLMDVLYNQSRNFSRKINDVDTGANYKQVLLGMMGNYCSNTKLIVTGSTEVDWAKISALTKKTLYRVLQELMINMQKHSGATLVSISFEQGAKTLKVDYMDNGVGATKEELNVKNGLWNTEKRILAIGGTVIFDSKKGHGFEAQIEISN